SAIIAAGETVVGASDGELLFPRAHEGLTRPFATAVIIDGVDVVIARDQRAAQHGLAAARGDVPPALGGPTVVLLVADRDPDPVAGVVAEAEIGKRRRARERPCDGTEGGADQPPHAAQAPWRTRDGRRWNGRGRRRATPDRRSGVPVSHPARIPIPTVRTIPISREPLRTVNEDTTEVVHVGE